MGKIVPSDKKLVARKFSSIFEILGQSETWLVHAKSSRTASEAPGAYEFSASRPCFKGKSQESSHEPGGSDVVRELSRKKVEKKGQKRAQNNLCPTFSTFLWLFSAFLTAREHFSTFWDLGSEWPK